MENTPGLGWLLSGYSGFLPQAKDKYVSLTGDPKLALGVNVSVDGCLCLSDSSETGWCWSRMYPASLPVTDYLLLTDR